MAFIFDIMKKDSIFAPAFKEYLMRYAKEKWQSGRMRQS